MDIRQISESSRTAWPFSVFVFCWGFFSHNDVDNYFALFFLVLMASFVIVNAKVVDSVCDATAVEAG